MYESREKGMFRYRNVVQERDGTFTVGRIKGIPDITQRGSIGELSAWFLGPRAENQDLLRNIINQAIDKTVAYRMLFEPDDPIPITTSLIPKQENKASCP